jgi:hypothetical protein
MASTGRLADLALVSGDRGGIDDHPALAVPVGRAAGHFGGGKAHQVKAAYQVDPDDGLEILQLHRPVAPDDSLGRGYSGAADQDAAGSMFRARLVQRGLHGPAVGNVAIQAQPTDPVGYGRGAVAVAVQHRDLRARLGQGAGRRRPQARRAACYDSRYTFDIHRIVSGSVWFGIADGGFRHHMKLDERKTAHEAAESRAATTERIAGEQGLLAQNPPQRQAYPLC